MNFVTDPISSIFICKSETLTVYEDFPIKQSELNKNIQKIKNVTDLI